MYHSKVKEHFRGNKFLDKEYAILFDVGSEKVMIYDYDSNLIYDLYKNKLEVPQERIKFESFEDDYELELVAKKDYYRKAYNLDGVYVLDGCFVSQAKNRSGRGVHSVTKLKVFEKGDTEMRAIFPSRFMVHNLIEKKTGKYLGGVCEE